MIVHPVMSFLGGGERLCCDSIRALLSAGHDVTLLSEEFDSNIVESYFGYSSLFDRIQMLSYPKQSSSRLGSYSHLISTSRIQKRMIGQSSFDLVFSTQDPGYIPELKGPIVQWGYFPRQFPRFQGRSFAKAIRAFPMRLHYRTTISRIGLVLAISEYSKFHLDQEWGRPSSVIYPSCNMLSTLPKGNIVVTVGRAIPEKRLDIFWDVARALPEYEFRMLLTIDPQRSYYLQKLEEEAPSNGTLITNPSKRQYDKNLGEAKVYLHLMKGEHFGIAIVEAMSAQCIPIVHNSGGPKEIVDNETGFKWETIGQIPPMIDQAIKRSPCQNCQEKAQRFSHEEFEKKLSSVFFELSQ